MSGGGAILTGQRVAILGGAGRMGSAVARAVTEAGAQALLLGRDRTTLRETADALGDGASVAVVDVSDRDALRAALHDAGPLDHLVVAVSAGARAGGIGDTAPEAAKAAFGRFWVGYDVLHLAPDMLRDGGSVTLISGSSARTPARGAGVWTALHGAIEALARAASIDIAPLRVNVVSPGGVEMAPDRQLVARPNRAADVGMAVAALIANPAITGAVLDVDGGERKGTWSGPASDERRL